MATHIRGWAVLACLLLVPHSTFAADTEASAGYSLLGVPGEGVAPIGWFASVAHQGDYRGLWAVFDVSGYYGAHSSVFTVGGGARLSTVRSRPRVFAQFLASVVLVGEDGLGYGGLFLEPGVGVDVPIRRRVSVRISGSTPALIFGDGAGMRFVRLQLGVTVPLTR